MKDNKSSFLLVLSLLLLSLSLVLLSIWGYRFFNTNQKNKSGAFQKEASALAKVNTSTRDSLIYLYTNTISKLDLRIDSAKNTTDSLRVNVDDKMTQIISLKEEIKLLLKSEVTNENLSRAREKINELRWKVEELQNKNLSIEKENEQLKAMLLQYNNNGSLPHTDAAPASKLPAVNNTTKTLPVATFVLTGIRVKAVFVKDDKDQETLQAIETQKINGSFKVKSNTATEEEDLFISIIQPNGKVLQNSDWEVGTFETPEGRKIYSQKIQIRLEAKEEKLLHFSISADSFDKGNYTVLIFHHGLVTGKLVLSLS